MTEKARPRFREDRPCPKCGGPAISEYIRKGVLETSDSIERHCCNCDYGWSETPLDAYPPFQQSAFDRFAKSRWFLYVCMAGLALILSLLMSLLLK